MTQTLTHHPTSRRRKSLKHAQGWLFLLPPLIVYFVFVIIPLVRTVHISFTDWNGARAVLNWVGLNNYARLLGDRLFLNALSHNLIWLVLGTFIPIAIGLGVSMLLWPRTRGRAFFQAAYFLPYVLPTIAVSVIWAQIYHPMFGILNNLLNAVGLSEWTRGWLGDEHVALYAILAAAIWAHLGFTLTVIMAGLQGVNYDLVEAATIDGAGAWQRFINVIVPQLSHVLTLLISVSLIGAFNVFDIVWVMTRGGPANATDMVSTVLYKKAFEDNQIAYGSAMAMTVLVISLILSVVFIASREREQKA